MTRNNYDITILGTAGGETVARGRYRLKERDTDSAVAKAVRLFRCDFPERGTDRITAYISGRA
jgi:hypothetical protein